MRQPGRAHPRSPKSFPSTAHAAQPSHIIDSRRYLDQSSISHLFCESLSRRSLRLTIERKRQLNSPHPNTPSMNKTQFYLSQCADAASKSPMCFTLGAVLVKGGKVISSGYNHHRPHYDGAEVRTRGHRKPVSMHAEMHAIFSLTGMSPSFRKQQQGARAGTSPSPARSLQTPLSVARAPPPTPPPSRPKVFKGPAPLATCEGHPRRLQRANSVGAGSLDIAGACEQAVVVVVF